MKSNQIKTMLELRVDCETEKKEILNKVLSSNQVIETKIQNSRLFYYIIPALSILTIIIIIMVFFLIRVRR